MRYRSFGRLGWQVSEVGYGMWGIAGGEGGWTGADDSAGYDALQRAVDLGCNFFDTAWIYGRGHSERMAATVRRVNPGRRLYIATKVPPKDRRWPSTRDSLLDAVFPRDHVIEYTEKSLDGLGVDRIDLLHFHVWEDSWGLDERWQRLVDELTSQRLVEGIAISVNRWEPWNVLKTLETGLVDAVQVGYNVFDQSPRDELFPYCVENRIGVIARVPFDEGLLTGSISLDSTWPEGDWRNSYFVEENLRESVPRVERVAARVPSGMSLPELALRFVLEERAVSSVIPGMRSTRHVDANLGVSDGRCLPAALMAELAAERWDREPTAWSQ